MWSWLALRVHNPPAGNRETRAPLGSMGTAAVAAAAAGAAPAVCFVSPFTTKQSSNTLVSSVCLGHAQSMPVYRCSASSGKPHPVTYLPPSLLLLSFNLSMWCSLSLSPLSLCLFSCVSLSLPRDCLKQLSALTQRLFSTAPLPLCLSLQQPHQFHSAD